jgi:hypothetical protein
MRFLWMTPLLCLLSCRSGQPPDPAAQLPTIPVTLPNGKVIRAELATEPRDQQRGLMFRTALAPDHGMLFVFPEPGNHPFWMYHTLIPLDILWLDPNRRIVFLSPNTPPCPHENPQQCPSYGGQAQAQFVLELAAGSIAAHGLQMGDTLRF